MVSCWQHLKELIKQQQADPYTVVHSEVTACSAVTVTCPQSSTWCGSTGRTSLQEGEWCHMCATTLLHSPDCCTHSTWLFRAICAGGDSFRKH